MDAFLERTYTISFPGGKSRKVLLILHKPTREVDGDWICEHRVEGLAVDEPQVASAFGVDSIQALLLSLQMAEARIQAHSRQSNGLLTWPDEDAE